MCGRCCYTPCVTATATPFKKMPVSREFVCADGMAYRFFLYICTHNLLFVMPNGQGITNLKFNLKILRFGRRTEFRIQLRPGVPEIVCCKTLFQNHDNCGSGLPCGRTFVLLFHGRQHVTADDPSNREIRYGGVLRWTCIIICVLYHRHL